MYVIVFSNLVMKDYKKFASEYLISEEGHQIIQLLLDGYKDPAVAVNSSMMLCDCIQQRGINEYLLDNCALLEPLFTSYAHSPTFEICSDVFKAISLLLRKNKSMVKEKLKSSDKLRKCVFGWFEGLINSKEYVCRRLSLQVGSRGRVVLSLATQ